MVTFFIGALWVGIGLLPPPTKVDPFLIWMGVAMMLWAFVTERDKR